MTKNYNKGENRKVMSDIVKYFERRYPGVDLNLVEYHQKLPVGTLLRVKNMELEYISKQFADRIDKALCKEEEKRLRYYRILSELA